MNLEAPALIKSYPSSVLLVLSEMLCLRRLRIGYGNGS